MSNIDAVVYTLQKYPNKPFLLKEIVDLAKREGLLINKQDVCNAATHRECIDRAKRGEYYYREPGKEEAEIKKALEMNCFFDEAIARIDERPKIKQNSMHFLKDKPYHIAADFGNKHNIRGPLAGLLGIRVWEIPYMMRSVVTKVIGVERAISVYSDCSWKSKVRPGMETLIKERRHRAKMRGVPPIEYHFGDIVNFLLDADEKFSFFDFDGLLLSRTGKGLEDAILNAMENKAVLLIYEHSRSNYHMDFLYAYLYKKVRVLDQAEVEYGRNKRTIMAIEKV
jgi:hypothetical protein